MTVGHIGNTCHFILDEYNINNGVYPDTQLTQGETTMKSREVFRPAQTVQLALIAVITGSVMFASVSALV
jgi:hypothetical protein